jgi:hypothetical protein
MTATEFGEIRRRWGMTASEMCALIELATGRSGNVHVERMERGELPVDPDISRLLRVLDERRPPRTFR